MNILLKNHARSLRLCSCCVAYAQIYAGGHHVDPEARAGREGTLLVKPVKVDAWQVACLGPGLQQRCDNSASDEVGLAGKAH